MTEQRPRADSDDLGVWADDDLVRALRAPGTPTELADQDRFVAAFRQAGASPVRSLPRRAAGRLGAGGTAVVVTVALTSGVAAAYTGNLPDPVQQIAHTVIGAPAPDTGAGHHHSASGPDGGRVATPPSTSGSPTAGASGTPGASPSTSPGGVPGSAATTPQHGTRGPSSGSSQTPASEPSGEPTTGTTSPPAGSGAGASAMSMSAPSHRVGYDQTVTLTGLVTDATGAPLPGHAVVLQVRGQRRWRPILDATTDSAGVATATTPAVTRSARLRWKADPGVTSPAWVVRMVPTLVVSADVGGATTTLAPSSQGSTAGDRIVVVKHVAGRTVLVRTAQLDATGTTQVTVMTPHRRAAYVVRLLATRRHAAAYARVVVVPPAPAAVTIAATASRVPVGGTTAVSGTVTSATGSALPGRRVVLQRRGPLRWYSVGHAVTDSSGQVTISTPPIEATSGFRLRTASGVHSAVWRVVELPTLTASATTSGGIVTISAATSGGRQGDRVVLLRRVNGQLVRVRHATLDADGAVAFGVPARTLATTYVVRLLATRRHAAASASITVPGTG